MGTVRILATLVASVIALDGPSQILSHPVHALIRSDALTSATRALLPIQIQPANNVDPGVVVSDVQTCSAGPGNSLRVVLYGRFSDTAELPSRRLEPADCARSLAELAIADCRSAPYFVATGSLRREAPPMMLTLDEGLQFERSGAACRAGPANRLRGLAYALDERQVFASFPGADQLGMTVIFRDGDALVGITPAGHPLRGQDTPAHLARLFPRTPDPLSNVAVALHRETAAEILNVALEEHPLILRLQTGIRDLPGEFRLASVTMEALDANRMRLRGPVTTDRSGTYDLSINVEGEDLRIESVGATYQAEDCSRIGNIGRRLECEARNRLRQNLARELGAALTRIYRAVPVRPFSSLYGLETDILGRRINSSAVIRRVERRGDELVFHAFIAPERLQ